MSVNAVLLVGSVIVSCLSLFFGLCKMELRKMTISAAIPFFKDREFGLRDGIEVFFSELLSKITLFLRFLICFSLYYVHENLLTFAIIYTCLDFVPIIIVGFTKFRSIKSLVGIKNIIDPNRIMFRMSVSYGWKNAVEINSLMNIYYSLVGITFSILFLSSEFSECNESCDQFVNRVERFFTFFVFCLVINVCLVIKCFVFAFKPLDRDTFEQSNWTYVYSFPRNVSLIKHNME